YTKKRERKTYGIFSPTMVECVACISIWTVKQDMSKDTHWWSMPRKKKLGRLFRGLLERNYWEVLFRWTLRLCRDLRTMKAIKDMRIDGLLTRGTLDQNRILLLLVYARERNLLTADF
ncbi:hypothetical protein GGI07_005875, partial [Coemansia sp. Benny D115]